MMNQYKSKKIAAFCVLLALTLCLCSMLYSCDKPDIYGLIENILYNKNLDGDYSFDAGLNIKINKGYLYENGMTLDFGEQLDAIPDELNFKIDGRVKDNQFEINIALEEFKTTVYKKDNALYFELNDFSKIILDFLCSTGFVDITVKNLFDQQVEYDNGTVLCFDLTDVDLSFFDKYIDEINSIVTVESKVNYNLNTTEDFDAADYDGANCLYFSDIKNKTEKELLKLPYYRYSELYIILETDENKDNFIHVLATRENGKTDLLEKVKIYCDLASILEDPWNIYSENIIPMRYILELFGESVGWMDETKQAYIYNGGEAVFFDGAVINSRTYISLAQIIAKTNYDLNSVIADEYVEIKLSRK